MQLFSEKKRTLLITIVIVLVAFLGYVAITWRLSPPPSNLFQPPTTVYQVVYSLTAEIPSLVKLGQDATFLLHIKNLDDKENVLEIGDPACYFVVSRLTGSLVSTQPEFVNDVLVYRRVESSGTHDCTTVWRRVGNEEHRILPGIYRVYGVLLTPEPEDPRTHSQYMIVVP